MICNVCAIGLHYVILKFLSVNLFLWGHELANSFLLFSVHKSFLQMIKKFSLRHRLHFLLILSYGLQVASTFHCTRNGFLASFRVHISFDSSVSFLLFAYRNEVMWFLYLSLKFVASPTYDSFVVSVVTDAWYTTFAWRHLPSSGHSGFFRQLHVHSCCVGPDVAVSCERGLKGSFCCGLRWWFSYSACTSSWARVCVCWRSCAAGDLGESICR